LTAAQQRIDIKNLDEKSYNFTIHFCGLYKLPSIFLIFVLSIQLFPILAVRSIAFIVEKTSPLSSQFAEKNHCSETCCKAQKKNKKDKEEGNKCNLEEIRDLQLFVQPNYISYWNDIQFVKQNRPIAYSSASKGFLAHVFQPPENSTLLLL
jgi:hypothetical protein